MLGTLCPNFISQLNKIPQTDEAKNTMSEYQSLFDYLSYHTKRKIVTPSDVALLYASLETMVNADNETYFKIIFDYFKCRYQILNS